MDTSVPQDPEASADLAPPSPDVPPGAPLGDDSVSDAREDSPAGPAPMSAADRLQTRVSVPERAGGSGRLFALVALVAIGLTVAYFFFGREGASPDTDLLLSLEAAADRFEPAFASLNPEEAEEYVMDEFGWPVRAPDLPGLSLVAVGEADLQPGIAVPAFRYDGPDGATALVFAFDYGFLDRARDRLTMPEAVYGRLAEPEPVDTRRLGDDFLVTWRVRATIYTAVLHSEAVFEAVGQSVRSVDPVGS